MTDLPDNSKVICPECCHQFGAISAEDQRRERDAYDAFDRMQDVLRVVRTGLVGYIGGIPSRQFAVGRLIGEIDAALNRCGDQTAVAPTKEPG